MTACYSEAEVAELCSPGKFKHFLKKKCGECGGSGFKVKYAKVSPLVVRAQISTFWCKECGRLLCEQHRHAHTCEAADARAARRRAMTGDEIREAARREEASRLDAEAKAEAGERAVKEARAASFHLWKTRRKNAASKSTHVANFVQRISTQADAGRTRNALLDMYTTCNRINLRLWNEVDTPSHGKFDFEAWAELKAVYTRACDTSGLVLTIDGLPLELEDAPQEEEEDTG